MAAVGGACTLRRKPVRWVIALVLGGLWWWSVFQLAVQPAETGPVEGAFAVGGWGLSLLPVHCGPSPRRRSVRERITRASRLRRSGAESGPS
jgi:hypothetical protein